MGTLRAPWNKLFCPLCTPISISRANHSSYRWTGYETLETSKARTVISRFMSIWPRPCNLLSSLHIQEVWTNYSKLLIGCPLEKGVVLPGQGQKSEQNNKTETYRFICWVVHNLPSTIYCVHLHSFASIQSFIDFEKPMRESGQSATFKLCKNKRTNTRENLHFPLLRF